MDLNERKQEILTHTLGLNRSRNAYRNHYCASPGSDGWEDLLDMVADGLMTRRSDQLSDMIVFHATDKGKALVTPNAGVTGAELAKRPR